MIAASDMVNSGRKPELLHRNPDEDIPETSDFLPIYKTTAMRTSLTGLDIPTARRLQLATLPLVLQFVWAASTSQDMKEAFFLTLANFVIIASLLPSAAGVWWLIRRARFFLGKSNSPKPCSQTTIWNWVVALSVGASTILHVPFIGLGFASVYFAGFAAFIVLAVLSGLDLLIQMGGRLRQQKDR